jgi:hypothetical protein
VKDDDDHHGNRSGHDDDHDHGDHERD